MTNNNISDGREDGKFEREGMKMTSRYDFEKYNHVNC